MIASRYGPVGSAFLATTFTVAEPNAYRNGTSGVAGLSDDYYDYNGHQEVARVSHAEHDQVWSVADAKARLSELLDHAISDGPQAITRRGREIAIVVSAEEWHRKSSRSGSLAEFFAASPLRGSGLDAGRPEMKAREVTL
jgi:prevent-host-death family protein